MAAPTDITVPELFGRWIANAALPEKSRNRKRRAFQTYLLKVVRTVRVRDLTPEYLKRLRRALTADGLTIGSAHYIVSDCLAQPLREAVRDGLLANDLFPQSRAAHVSERTVADYADEWAKTQADALGKWVLPVVGSRPLSALSEGDEARIRASMQAKGVQPGAIQAVLSGVFGHLWADAAAEGLAPRPRTTVERLKGSDREAGGALDGGRREMTVGEYVERWLSTISAPPYVSAYQTRHRRRMLEASVLPKIGHMRLDRVNSRIATELQLEMLDRGLSVATVKHALSSICGAIFRDAMTQGLTRQIPFRGLRWPREAKRRPDVFTEAEVTAIVEHFRTYSGGRWLVWVALLAGTGARPSEIAGLQWDSIDLKAGTAAITRALVAREETAGKTPRSLRVIGLQPHLVKLLEESRPPHAKGTDWICVGTDGRPIDSTNWAASKWRPALAGLGIKRRRLYVLRHSYISRALSAGAPPLAVAAYTGTSLAKLSETYASWLGDSRKDPLTAAMERERDRPPRDIDAPPATTSSEVHLDSGNPDV